MEDEVCLRQLVGTIMNGFLLDGSDADGEWSDGTEDSTAKSASLSDIEDSPPQYSSKPTAHVKGLSAKSSTTSSQPHQSLYFNGRDRHQPYDSVDHILDTIDSELYNMTHLQVPRPPVKRKRPVRVEQETLEEEEEGSEFETGDETNTESSVKKTGLPMIRVSKGSEDRDGTDTGLGTSSAQDSHTSTQDIKQILGTAHTYSELESSEGLSEEDTLKAAAFQDLDSDTAQQLDHQFKHILKRKKGGYLSGLQNKSRSLDTDLESIRTEDFEAKFKEVLVGPNKAKQKGATAVHLLPRKQTPPGVDKRHSQGSQPIKSQSSPKSSPKSSHLHPQMSHLGKKHAQAPLKGPLAGLSKQQQYELVKALLSQPDAVLGDVIKPRAKPRSSRQKKHHLAAPLHQGRIGRQGTNSDRDSIKTEDFENQFQSIMVKQVASVPIMSFDQMMVDSDLDTVKSHTIREKLRTALLENGSNSSEGELTPRVQDTSWAAISPLRTKLYEEQTQHSKSIRPAKHARNRPKTSPASHRRQQRALYHQEAPPPIWEKDEPSQHVTSSSNSNSMSSTMSSLTRSTFEEVESLDLSRSQSTDSLATGFHTSSSSRTSLDMELQMQQEQAALRLWQARRKLSLDQSSRSTSQSRANSTTFDEVESLDLGGHLDVDLQDVTSASGSLKSLDRLRTNGGQKHRRNGHRKNSANADDRSRRKSRDLIVDDPDDRYSYAQSRRLSELDRIADSKPVMLKDLTSQRSLMEQLLEYKQSSGSDNVSSSSYASSFSSNSYPEPAVKFPFESEYEYRVRLRKMSQGSVSSKTSGVSGNGPRSGLLSRTMSMESSSSSFSSSSPTDPFMYYNQPANAEDVLLNLGFCTSDSFLPERFAKDWFDKLIKARRERIQQFQQQELADMLEGLETPSSYYSVSTNQSGQSTPLRRRNSTADNNMFKSDILNQSHAARRGRFRRANTILTYHQDKGGNFDADLATEGSNDIPIIDKQDSMDQLKYVLEKQANLLHFDSNVKDKRRKQFASVRQNSLPLCLETLSEEDEGKTSRKPSLDGGHLKTFFEDEERMSRSSSKDSEMSRISDPGAKKQGQVDSDSSSVAPKSTSASLDDDVDLEILEMQENQEVSKAEENLENQMPVKQMSTSSEEDNPQQNRPTGQMVPSKSVPAIVVSGHRYLTPQSSSSLEIAEIMERNGGSFGNGHSKEIAAPENQQNLLHVEPAMLSVVLSDVEDGNGSHRDRLGPPSPASMLSASPIPVSPVTVIEVDHLDNQNDSMDSGDSLPWQSDGQSNGGEETGERPPMCNLQPISEEEMMSSDQSRSASFDDPGSQRSESGGNIHLSGSKGSSSNVEEITPAMKDSFVEADDGKLSPITMFNSKDRSIGESTWDSSGEEAGGLSDLSGDSPQPDSCETGAQIDDGTLSPIVLLSQWEKDEDLPDNMCWVQDQGTQWEKSFAEDCRNNNMKTSTTQTEITLIGPGTNRLISWEPRRLMSYNSAIDDFEPMCVCCSVACQTDLPPTSNNDHNGQSLVVKFHSLLTDPNLCTKCQRNLRNSLSSVDLHSPDLHSPDEDAKSDISATVNGGLFSSSYPGRKALNTTIERLLKKTRDVRNRCHSGAKTVSIHELSSSSTSLSGEVSGDDRYLKVPKVQKSRSTSSVEDNEGFSSSFESVSDIQTGDKNSELSDDLSASNLETSEEHHGHSFNGEKEYNNVDVFQPEFTSPNRKMTRSSSLGRVPTRELYWQNSVGKEAGKVSSSSLSNINKLPRKMSREASHESYRGNDSSRSSLIRQNHIELPGTLSKYSTGSSSSYNESTENPRISREKSYSRHKSRKVGQLHHSYSLNVEPSYSVSESRAGSHSRHKSSLGKERIKHWNSSHLNIGHNALNTRAHSVEMMLSPTSHSMDVPDRFLSEQNVSFDGSPHQTPWTREFTHPLRKHASAEFAEVLHKSTEAAEDYSVLHVVNDTLDKILLSPSDTSLEPPDSPTSSTMESSVTSVDEEKDEGPTTF